MTHIKTRSKVLLLFCLPLLALTGIAVKGRPHPAQLTHSRLSSSRPLGTAHAFIKGNQSMALNTAGYAANGAGTVAANGNYPPASSANATYNSTTQFTNGTDFITYTNPAGSGNWELRTAANGGGTLLYTGLSSNGGNQGANFPSSWSVNGGVAPAPTFTAIASVVAPTGVTATPQAGLGVVINCTNAAAQPSGTTYNLLKSTTSGGEGTTPIATNITLPYTSQEAAAGTEYYILQAANGSAAANSAEVSAFAYDQASGFSNTASATPSVPAPGAVTGLTATLTDNGTAPSIALAWALPTSGQAITGINVRSGNASGGESTAPLNAAQLAASATSFAFQAAYNQDYFLVVDTIDAGGTATSAEVHIKTDVAAPTNLTATGGNNQTVLRWANNTGTLGEMIQYSLDNVNWNNLITLATVVGTYTDTAATNGVKRYYRLADLN